VTTKVINHTVTTGRYRSKSSKYVAFSPICLIQADIRPVLVSGKLAGIIIGAIIGVVYSSSSPRSYTNDIRGNKLLSDPNSQLKKKRLQLMRRRRKLELLR